MKTSYLIIPALNRNLLTDPLKYEPSSFEEEVFINEIYSGEEEEVVKEKETDYLPEYTMVFNSEYVED